MPTRYNFGWKLDKFSVTIDLKPYTNGELVKWEDVKHFFQLEPEPIKPTPKEERYDKKNPMALSENE